MNFEQIRASELTLELEARWLEILQGAPSLDSPYFTPQFFRAVASVRDDARVTVMRSGNDVVGFFPFQRSKFGISGPLGGHLSDYQAVICDPSLDFDVRELLQGTGLSTWDFDHLLAEQTAFQPFVSRTSESPLLCLKGGYEAYAAELRQRGSKQLQNVGRKARKLGREVGEVKFEFNSKDEALLQRVISNKRRQCARTDVLDVFAPPWTVKLLTQICRTDEPEFAGVMSVLRAGETPVAIHMGMRSKNTLHWWFPTYEEEYSKYSPGLILLLSLAEHAASMGLTAVDLGKGDDGYKRNFQTSSVALVEGRADVPSVASTALHARETLESWARNSPLRAVAKRPGRALKRIAKRLGRR